MTGRFSRSFRSSGNNRGFTLIEVLLAVSLMAVLLASLYSVFFSVAGAGSKASEEAVRNVEAGRALEKMASEVRSAYTRRGSPVTFFKAGKVRSHSMVSFTFFSYPVQAGGAPKSDLLAVSYSIERDGGRRHLVKEVWSPYLGEKISFRAIEDIKGFEVSLFNGKDWSKAWDSELEGSVPRAMTVKMTLASGEELAMTAPARIR
ncbi:MAG: prepilin-type N-terminal cleavage/methylation domain-containing protein [Deltaproteobacteria bacterium]|nr:prepilin-type N-terminal cleavage/methylation domain-containing protein [Deltaproteobacteria bacterium]